MQVTYRKASFEIDDNSQICDLQNRIEAEFLIPVAGQTLLANGKRIGSDPKATVAQPVGGKVPAKIMVLGNPQKVVDKVNAAANEYIHEQARREQALATLHSRKRAPIKITPPTEYTFHEIKALPYGDSQAALEYLHRLKDDLGVRTLMEKYKLRVSLLTELDPTVNTDTEKRRLGLNENHGQIIRLRIRTDDYGGFCNYNEIKKVLCHELAHNTHDGHDAAFWKVCRQYEREIDIGWGAGKRLDA